MGDVDSSEPLVRVMRGDVVESEHRGAFASVERPSPPGAEVRGEFVCSRGDPERLVFYRSASKPLQALEVVACGAADAFGLSPRELAVAAGSHSGEAFHLEAVRSILSKAGVPESALRCGGHRSANPDVAFAQKRDGVPVTSILSNCSGKHAAMLAAAKHRGEPLEGYLDPAHPVQRAITDHVRRFAGLERSALAVETDGCGAPAIALPLVAMARSLARFGAPDGGIPAALAEAARRIGAAMTAHPEMVAGTDRFDTDLMRAGEGALIAKAGAEGVHVVSVPARRMGLAVKVDDGNDRGYRTVVVEELRRRDLLTDAAAAALLEKHAPPVVRSLAGVPVGRVEIAF
jgi:L-asparaginase II